MRRRYSLAMGLVLVAAMLAGQASVSVLAQGTPAATPSAGGLPPGVQIDDTGVYVVQFGETPEVTGDNNLYLLRISAPYKTELPFGEAQYPAAILHVETGQFVVTIHSGEDIQITVGDHGSTIKTNKGDCKPGMTCPIAVGETVTLGEDTSISLKQATFTVTSESPSATKSFQPGFNVMTASVVQVYTPCGICPGH